MRLTMSITFSQTIKSVHLMTYKHIELFFIPLDDLQYMELHSLMHTHKMCTLKHRTTLDTAPSRNRTLVIFMTFGKRDQYDLM
jgi:hypothetical protein